MAEPRRLWTIIASATVVLAGFSLTLSGCTNHTSVADEVVLATSTWHPPTAPIGLGAAVSSADNLPDRSIVPVSGYVQEAFERNPSVKAAAADAQAKLERIAQVTSLPDPLVRAIVRPEPVQTAAGDMYLTLGISQKILLPARLDRAGKAAAAEVRIALARLEAARLQVVADVEHAFYRLYVVDRSIELTAAHRRSLENLEQVLASQYRVGRAEQQDLLRIQTEIAKLHDDESRLARRRSTTAAWLNQLIDYPPNRDVAETTPLSPRTINADVDRLIALAAEHNPQLAALVHQAERNQAEIELARLARWPDATVGFEWTYTEPRDPFIPPINPETGAQPPYSSKSDQGDDNWAITLQFNLPIWLDRLEAAEREARLKLERTEHDRQSAANRIAFEVYDAWTRVQSRQETAVLLASTIIPQARQTYEVSLTAYQAGKADFLAVIDNWRRLLDFELSLHREVAEMESAFSDLELAVGVQLIRADEAWDNEK